MTRPIAVAGVLVLALAATVQAASGVSVEGSFVRAGTFTEVTQVSVGQPVQLIVRVRDTSDVPEGVAGGLVDVTWNDNVLELQDDIDGNNTDTSDVAPLFNQAVWTQFFSGFKDGSDSLADMGAGQGPPPTLMLGDAEVFFTLSFNTVGTGSADMTLTGHDFGLIVTGSADATAQQHASINPTLTVVQVTSDPNTTGHPSPAPSSGPCLAPAMAVGLLMLGGCSRTISRRRPRGR